MLPKHQKIPAMLLSVIEWREMKEILIKLSSPKGDFLGHVVRVNVSVNALHEDINHRGWACHKNLNEQRHVKR